MDRFEKFVSPEPNSGCWLWAGAAFNDGYGAFRFRGRQQKAHRVSFILHRHEIPDGMQVCHTCDCKCCVNPSHLFLGLHADNMADRNRKGRQAHGLRQWQAKLTPTLVEEIRDRHRRGKTSMRALAREFLVSKTTIKSVLIRKLWKRLP